jgi:hypothetical protein
MQDLTDDERKQVLGEALFDELRAIREGIAELPTRTELNRLSEKVDTIDENVITSKLAVKDQSQQLESHEQRITVLEVA